MPTNSRNGTVADRPLTVNELQERLNTFSQEVLAANALSRSSFLSKLIDPRRNIDDECGYPGRWVDPWTYQDLYDREPVATRVVQLYPMECWQVQPTVYEVEESDKKTPFEEDWKGVNRNLMGESKYADEYGSPVWEYLKRADVLSGIGRYGLILFGIDDGRPLWEPAEGFEESNSFPAAPERDENGKPAGAFLGTPFNWGIHAKAVYNLSVVKPKRLLRNQEDGGEEDLPEGVTRRLLYLRVFPESLAQINRYETNPTSPRYGFPVEYTITLNDPALVMDGIGYQSGAVRVHWTRVLHVAEVTESSEFLAPPRMQHVLNPILDCRKIRGSSAEGYWRCGFPGYSFETHPELGGDVDVNRADMRDMFEEWLNGLQRGLFTSGFTVKTLSPSVTDPTTWLLVHIQAICIKMGCPQRVFMGSERGELASSQDDAAWNDRLKERQWNYLTPRLIIPFVDRLIAYGVLPEPEEYHVFWPDLTSQTGAEKASVALQKTQAAGQYVTSGANQLIPEFDFYTRFLGFTDDEAQAILDAKMEQIAEQEAGETSQGSALLQLVGGITGALEMFKAAKEGALSEDQLKQLLMLFYQLSEGKAEEIIGDGLTPAAEEAGDPPEPGPPVIMPGAGPPGADPPKPGQVPPFGKPPKQLPAPPLPPAANRLHTLYFSGAIG